MNLTSADFPPEEDEFVWAGLEAVDSEKVAPQRVARAKAAFECVLTDIVSMGNGHMVFGDVVSIFVDDDVMVDGHISAQRLEPVGRLGGAQYSVVREVVEIERPRWKDLKEG
jgi:flavin reductase (DIM6/NTAB) family NADH-FMN oxidoreductase RutF